jgi:hypothetical protein
VVAALPLLASSRRYVRAALLLTHALELAHGDDLVGVAGLSGAREALVAARNRLRARLFADLTALLFQSTPPLRAAALRSARLAAPPLPPLSAAAAAAAVAAMA